MKIDEKNVYRERLLFCLYLLKKNFLFLVAYFWRKASSLEGIFDLCLSWIPSNRALSFSEIHCKLQCLVV